MCCVVIYLLTRLAVTPNQHTLRGDWSYQQDYNYLNTPTIIILLLEGNLLRIIGTFFLPKAISLWSNKHLANLLVCITVLESRIAFLYLRFSTAVYKAAFWILWGWIIKNLRKRVLDLHDDMSLIILHILHEILVNSLCDYQKKCKFLWACVAIA